MRRSHETPPGSGITLELNLDSDAIREEFSKSYFKLADDIRDAGLDPNTLPDWKRAADAFFDVKDALKQYEKPKSQAQVDKLESRIRKAFADFNNDIAPALDAVIAEARGQEQEVSEVKPPKAETIGNIKKALLKENITQYETKQYTDEISKRAAENLKEGWTAEEFAAYEGTREEMKRALSDKIEKLQMLTWGSGEKAEVIDQDIDAGVLAIASTERKPRVKPEAVTSPAATELESARAIMNAAGEAYFAAYKEIHKKGLANADAGPEKEALAELKRTYDATRAAYYRDSLKQGADWGTLQKEVLFNSVARETELKIEGLSEKQRGSLMKAVEWYGGMNRGLETRFGRNGARLLRAAVSGVIAAGATAGGVGILAAAGYGTWRAAKAYLGFVAGGAVAETAGTFFKSRAMKSADAARARLGMAGGALGNELSVDEIERMDAQRRKLSYDASEARVARKVALGKALVALGFGGVLSIALAEGVVEADIKSPGGPSTTGPVAEQPPVPPEVSVTPEPLATPPVETPAPTPETSLTPAPVPEGLDDMNAVVDEIHEVTAKRGDGAIRMLDRLHDDLVAKGITPDSPGISPEMKAVLEADTPAEVAELAKKLGFYDPENVNESAVISRGASLKFEDGKLVFTQTGGQPQVLGTDTPYTGAFNDTTASGAKPQVQQVVAQSAPATAPITRAPTPVYETTTVAPVTVDSREAYERLSDTEKVAYLNANNGVVPGAVSAVQVPESSLAAAPPVRAQESVVAPAPTESVSVSESRLEATSSSAIQSITESPVWSAYKDQDSWTLVFLDLPPGSPEAGIRGQIFNLMRSTGVGPAPGEQLDDYLARANAAIESGAAETTAIYQVDGYAVARGGDLLARQILATEYEHIYPNVPVIIENANGYSETELFQGKFINKVVTVPLTPGTSNYSKRLF